MQRASQRYLSNALVRLLAITTLSGGLLFGATDAKASWSFDQVLRKAEKRYGRTSPAKDRLQAWNDLLENSRQQSELDKLQAVNRYINQQVRFNDDIALWKRKDYWATPVETLTKGAGDCEDFSLAKYFSLLQLGIPQEKLRITYVRALELNQAHMVVTYYPSPDAEPLVLDNLVERILPASQRKDLALLYAFDARGLYAIDSGSLQRVGDTERLPFWQALLERMRREGFRMAQLPGLASES
ncbi:transglutaminase-like cysteine peptidase [Pseudomonas cavernae]|uniref:transglutaminase-like cysteine peptidase n=1 Tax=Pseudomonas cavernae TaxID=2320867 RepID=UPI003B75BC29